MTDAQADDALLLAVVADPTTEAAAAAWVIEGLRRAVGNQTADQDEEPEPVGNPTAARHAGPDGPDDQGEAVESGPFGPMPSGEVRDRLHDLLAAIATLTEPDDQTATIEECTETMRRIVDSAVPDEPAERVDPVAEVWARVETAQSDPEPGWLPPGHHLNLLHHRRRDDQPNRPI